MGNDLVRYNGYEFNQYSHISVAAVMQPDDANRTTLYNRYTVRVESTIYAEDGDRDGEAGEHFRRVRERLSKQGKELIIHHKGFSPSFAINSTDTGPRDVNFGPKPKLINWEPVGEENAVEVIWECEFCISQCSRWSGIMAINYGVVSQVDRYGYTTRTIAGYLEIAMSVSANGTIPDTADAYREQIVASPLPNFEREHTWHLSLDKRRADFSIVDTEIRSPNAYPVGVIAIRANHTSNWHKRQSSELPQTIRATIELAQGQPRSRAWEIFKAIIESRLKHATSRSTVLLEGLFVDEDLFGNTFSLAVSYRFYVRPDESILTSLPYMFSETGISEPLHVGTWGSWKRSVAGLQSHRGQANLAHKPDQDQIVDLCGGEFEQGSSDTSRVVYTPSPRKMPSLRNKRPTARKSYLVFNTWLETIEDVPTTFQVTIGPDDLKLSGTKFNPEEPDAKLGDPDTAVNIERYVETQSGSIEIVWKGYAERVGYPIPRPNKLKLGDVELRRIGKGVFAQRRESNSLGQIIYKAAWVQRYIMTKRPEKISASDLNEWDSL